MEKIYAEAEVCMEGSCLKLDPGTIRTRILNTKFNANTDLLMNTKLNSNTTFKNDYKFNVNTNANVNSKSNASIKFNVNPDEIRCNRNRAPGLTELMRSSRDCQKLSDVWRGWRDQSGKKMKQLYQEYVQLSNEAIRLHRKIDY